MTETATCKICNKEKPKEGMVSITLKSSLTYIYYYCSRKCIEKSDHSNAIKHILLEKFN